MNRWTRVGTTLTGLVLVALVGLPVLPSGHAASVALTAVDDGVVLCMMCDYNGSQHAFWPFTCGEPSASEDGSNDQSQEGFQCSRCGGTSDCHADARPGRCHLPCAMATSMAALDQTAETVETLVERAYTTASDGDGSDNTLVSIVNEEASLEYNPIRKSVQLLDCRGGVVGHWRVPDAMVVALTQDPS